MPQDNTVEKTPKVVPQTIYKTTIIQPVTTPLSDMIVQGREEFSQASGVVTLLLILMFLDVLSGTARAIIQRKLNSTTSYKGLVKKASVLIAIALCAVFDPFLTSISLTLIIAWAFSANEAISILENLGQAGIWLPPQLTTFFERLREQNANSFDHAPKPSSSALVDLATDVMDNGDKDA